MLKMRVFSMGLILTLLLMGVASSLSVNAQDNTLIVARANDATGLDPHTQTAFTSQRLLELVYEPLVRTDAQLNLIPALAESWEFSGDATTLTFTLRQGVTFHDGSDFTSADVVASLERILLEETGAATRSNLLSIESIEAPDDFTIVLHLSMPDVPLLTALSSWNTMILPSELIENGDPTTDVIGTGPFVLDEWTPDVEALLSANPNYWGEGPFIDGIEMRIIPDESSILAALRAGEIDVAILDDPAIATLPLGDSSARIERAPDISYHVLQLRAESEPLSNLKVRQAISCAINRQEVVDTAAFGEGQVTGPITVPAYAIALDQLFCYEQDVELARQLMAEAGYEDGFDLTVIAAEAEPPTALTEAQVIQDQLAEIGINVEIEPLELGVYVDRWLAADFDAAIALNGGRTDPYTMYSRYWIKDAQFNAVAGYIDDTLDSLMKAAQAESDPAARTQLFNDLEKHLAEMAPWVWLYTGYSYTGLQDYVEGFVPNPTRSLFSFSTVTLNR